MAMRREYTLHASTFVKALLGYLAAQLYPKDDPQRPDERTLSLRTGNPKGNVSPMGLFESLGRIVPVSAGDISMLVAVPRLEELLVELMSVTSISPIFPQVTAVAKELGLPTDGLVARFGSLPPASQDLFLNAVRPAYAATRLMLLLTAKTRAVLQVTNPVGAVLADAETVGQEMRQRASLGLWSQLFRLRYWYDDLPSEHIHEFLPPGSVERSPSVFANVPALSLSKDRVEQSAFSDPSWYDFYVGTLGAKRVLRPTGEFAERRYVAFLFELDSGVRVAVLDADKRRPSDHDAIYVFLIAREEHGATAEWVHSATLCKTDLLKRKRGEGSFWGRHYHSDHWQKNLRCTLDKLRRLEASK